MPGREWRDEMSEFKKGDEVYLTDGSKAEYVQKLDDGRHLVSPLFVNEVWRGDEDDPYSEEIEAIGHKVVSHVSLDQGNRVMSELAGAIEAKRKELSAVISEVRGEIRGLELELKAKQDSVEGLMKDLARHDGLEKIRDLFEGKITHVVYTNDIKVKTMKMEDFARSSDVKAFGIDLRGGWNTKWTAKVRYDYVGEHRASFVWLCSNDAEIDHAVAVAKERVLAKAWGDTLKRKPDGTEAHWCIKSDTLEAYAKDLGEDNPTVMTCRAWLSQHNAAKAAREQEAKRAQLEKLQAELNA